MNRIDSVETVAGAAARLSWPGKGGPFGLFILLHGLTGDENSMSIFAARLPANAAWAAPRGLFPSVHGGYTWCPPGAGLQPSVGDLDPAVRFLQAFLDDLAAPGGRLRLPADLDLSQVHLVGFSLGAALAYAYTLNYPQRVKTLAALAGFLPGGIAAADYEGAFGGLRLFVSHGARDDVTPVELARQAVRFFSAAGADVDYCETDSGHKLGAACFRAFEHFYRQFFPDTPKLAG